MNAFLETLSIVGGFVVAIVAGIIVLVLFFSGLSWLSSGRKPDKLSVRGVLQQDTLATVHLAGGKTFERVRFVGYTNADSIKAHIPYELSGMVILEDEEQTRFLVRPNSIRMIVIPP